MSTVYLYARFQAEPGQADSVASLLADYGRAVTAESGNLRFDAHRLTADTDHFFVYEQYADADAFQHHIATPHCAEFNDALAPLVVGGGSELTWLEPVA